MSDTKKGSRIAGFYNFPLEKRIAEISERVNLSPEELEVLRGNASMTVDQADNMIENVVGLHSLPLGIALNFKINGRDILIP